MSTPSELQMRTLTHQTPAGPLVTIVDGHVVRAAGFTDDPSTLSRRLGLAAPPPARTGSGEEEGATVDAAILAYLAGDTAALDDVDVAQPGTPFQQAVWGALRTIPAGHQATYTTLAEAVGRPAAVRAVGSACGRNLIAPFVPCHRAVRADGTLGGYRYGLGVKEWLLRHENGHSHGR